MPTTINKTQVIDSDFALQAELDLSTGLPFDHVNMNNHMIFNSTNILKDNGNLLFDPSLMNNVELYNYIVNTLSIDNDKYYYEYLTNVTITSTTNVEIFNFNTPSLNAGLYKIDFSYNFQPNKNNKPLAYFDISLVLNTANTIQLSYERKTPSNITTRSYAKKGFILANLNSGINNISFIARVSSPARPHVIGNFKIYIKRWQ